MTPKCAQIIFLLHEDSAETMGESSEDCNYSDYWGSTEDKSRCPVSSLSTQTKGCISLSPRMALWIGAEAGCSDCEIDVFCAAVLLVSWIPKLQECHLSVCGCRQMLGCSKAQELCWIEDSDGALPRPRLLHHGLVHTEPRGSKGSSPAGTWQIEQQSTRVVDSPGWIQSWAMPQSQSVVQGPQHHLSWSTAPSRWVLYSLSSFWLHIQTLQCP